MRDIAAFIHARLDEGEQAARAATPGPWRWTNAGSGIIGEQPVLESESDPTAVVIDATGNHTEGYVCIDAGDQAHIAHWDPARVLAEVEAKRLLVNAHARPHECISLTGTGERSVVDGKPWELWEPEHTDDHGPCFVLRCLALPYDWHPDYQQEWRP